MFKKVHLKRLMTHQQVITNTFGCRYSKRQWDDGGVVVGWWWWGGGGGGGVVGEY